MMNTKCFKWLGHFHSMVLGSLMFGFFSPLSAEAEFTKPSASQALIATASPSARQITKEPPTEKPTIKKKKSVIQKTVGNDYTLVIQDHLEEIQKCYDDQLKKGTTGSGKLVVKWTIDPSGKSTDFVQEKNDLNSNDLFHCAIQAIGQWKFPKDRPIQFRYTFHLAQQDREIRVFKPDNNRFQKSSKSTRHDF